MVPGVHIGNIYININGCLLVPIKRVLGDIYNPLELAVYTTYIYIYIPLIFSFIWVFPKRVVPNKHGFSYTKKHHFGAATI